MRGDASIARTMAVLMELTSLRQGRFLRRWQRFLAEVVLADGPTVLAHVPNSGRLTGVVGEGRRCWVAPATGGKLPYRLEILEADGVLVGINTQRAAKLAEEALLSGLLTLPGLSRPFALHREVSPVAGSRLDVLLTDASGRFWVEVKNVTLVVGGVGLFPDAVTARGRKHLEVLTELVRRGERGAVVYVVQRQDAQAVRAAEEIDPAYAQAARAAAESGVVFAALEVAVSPTALTPVRVLPVTGV